MLRRTHVVRAGSDGGPLQTLTNHLLILKIGNRLHSLHHPSTSDPCYDYRHQAFRKKRKKERKHFVKALTPFNRSFQFLDELEAFPALSTEETSVTVGVVRCLLCEGPLMFLCPSIGSLSPRSSFSSKMPEISDASMFPCRMSNIYCISACYFFFVCVCVLNLKSGRWSSG